MALRLIDEITVPAEQGRAFRVYEGQTMRIIAIEGPQTGNVAFFDAHDYRWTYDAHFSYMANNRLGVGSSHKLKYIYSRLPRAALMMEVTEDRVGRHWVPNAAPCSAFTNKLLGLPESARSCHGNIAEAISDFGMTPDQVPNGFALWTAADIMPDGAHKILPSPAKQGDSIDFFTHMHCVVAVSACPMNQNNVTEINAGKNKALKVEIWEGSSW